MSTAYRTGSEFDSRWPLAAVVGALAGLLRPVAVGVLSAAGLDPGVVAMTVQPDLPMWWLVHLVYSFGFGALYGFAAYRGRLRAYVRAPRTGAAVGVGYGIVLWAINVLVVWEGVVRTVVPPVHTGGSVVGPLVGHLVYGLVLGALYPVARRYA